MRAVWPSLWVLCAGCGAGAALPTTTLTFRADPPLGEEAYACFGFDADAARGQAVTAIDWTPPAPGAVVLHHAKLYAVAQDYPDGPVSCDGMPSDALPIDLWLPGGGGLRLPAGVGVAVPEGTVRFVVETHALRPAAGVAGDARATLTFVDRASVTPAAWTSLPLPVPALRPLHTETVTGGCALAAPVHLYTGWPHMHLAGQAFTATLTRAGGAIVPLVDVATWDFQHQAGVTLDLDAGAGDRLDVSCTWWNGSDRYILPGPRTSDEMCALGLIASASASRPLCP